MTITDLHIVAGIHRHALSSNGAKASYEVLNLLQVTGMMSQSNEDRMKEHSAIQVITERCSRQSMADTLHDVGYKVGMGMWNSLVGDGELYHHYYPSDMDDF